MMSTVTPWASALYSQRGSSIQQRYPARSSVVNARGARGWEMVTVLTHCDSGVRCYVTFFQRRVSEGRE
jgi:hypothetical protein